MPKTPIPEDFKITPEMRRWAREKGVIVDIDAETEIFCDYWKGHGRWMCDWLATWRNWMRRAPLYARPQRVNEMPHFRPLERSVSPPIQIREHPLFKKLS
jgi:hypothetical protein